MCFSRIHQIAKNYLYSASLGPIIVYFSRIHQIAKNYLYSASSGPVIVCFSRIHQIAKNYLYSASSGLYSCPLAMTDGAAKSMEVQYFLSMLWS